MELAEKGGQTMSVLLSITKTRSRLRHTLLYTAPHCSTLLHTAPHSSSAAGCSQWIQYRARRKQELRLDKKNSSTRYNCKSRWYWGTVPTMCPVGHTGLVCKFWRFSILCIICVLCYEGPVLALNVMQVLAVFYFVYFFCFRLSRPSFDVKCFIALWLFPNQCFSL